MKYLKPITTLNRNNYEKIKIFNTGNNTGFPFSGYKISGTTDFFTGKWNLMIAGTPNGDVKMIVTPERKEGKLGGTIKIEAEGYDEPVKLSKVNEKEVPIIIYFNADNYELYIYLFQRRPWLRNEQNRYTC